jgi:hypothetical protein
MLKEQTYYLVKYGKLDYQTVQNIPIWERNFYVHKLKEEADKMEAERDKQRKKQSGGDALSRLGRR